MAKRTLSLSLMAAAVLILPGVVPAAGQSEAPLESQATLDPMGASYWTGTWTETGYEPGSASPRASYTELVDAVSRGLVTADDPRIAGTKLESSAATKRDGRRTPMASKAAPKPESPRVRKARATIAATETLAGTAYTEAIGSPEVQAALETVNGHGAPDAESTEGDAAA